MEVFSSASTAAARSRVPSERVGYREVGASHSFGRRRGIASAVDTLLFFALAFAGTAVPWVTLAVGDYGAKLAMALVMLVPFRALMPVIRAKAERVGA